MALFNECAERRSTLLENEARSFHFMSSNIAFPVIQTDIQIFFMCGGIEYQGHKIYFPNPEARLPVYTRDGKVSWVPWGSREKNGKLIFPNGGWARLDSIATGKWKPWHPRPVLIACNRFMEKDAAGVSHWFDVSPQIAIQGLLAERSDKQLVYVVTESPPRDLAWIHDRWPRMIKMTRTQPPVT